MCVYLIRSYDLNTLRPRQNGRHIADNIFKRTLFNENLWISIKISLKFVHKGPNEQYFSIASDNCCASVRRHAIIWTNDG